MLDIAKKLVRTTKVQAPWINELKYQAQNVVRGVTKTPHERDFEALQLLNLPDLKSALLVDVGANRGQSIRSAQLFVDWRIASFEANPELAERLQDRYGRDSGVQIFPFGLGKDSFESTLYVPRYNDVSLDGIASLDFDAANNWLTPDSLYFFNIARYQVVPLAVTIRTLDSFSLKPSVIKIDVQGTELDVLFGARNTISRHEPVLLIERPSPEICDLLLHEGYSPMRFEEGGFIPGHGRQNTFFLKPQHLSK